MLELALQRGSKVLVRQAIGEAPLTIGRSSGNTIKLADPDISRHHCKIEWKDGALFVEDLSTNGTLVNGELKRAAEINIGDTITVGQWTMSIETTVDAVPVKTIASAPGLTKVISFDSKERKLTTETIEFTVQSPDQAPLKKKLAAGEITLGHHAACDLSIADPFVSRRHCKIIVQEGVPKLIDLASTNGTFIGSVQIDQTVLPMQGSFGIGRSVVAYKIVRSSEKISVSDKTRLGKMIGPSKAMRGIFAVIEKAGPSDATICIAGESGTGKELVARELHDISPRRRGPFIAVNCGAMPASIIESQLFGHERGAFTGAVERMTGLFEQAKGGTIFLDEIGEMPLDLQTRLLRVLEERMIRRVGGQEDIPVDARVICATNRDLKRKVSEGTFREDLFFRIFVVPIEIPPLRERPEDIVALTEHFILEASRNITPPSLTKAAMERLVKHSWPGNARELKNTLERSLLFGGGKRIDAKDIRIVALENSASGEHLRDRERDILTSAINGCGGNLSRAAKKLGLARTTMQKKIKRFAIEVPRNTREPK